MTSNTYIVSDCNGATFKRLSVFLTRGKAKAMRVVYDAESGTLGLLTSTGDTCFMPDDDGVTHARIPVGAAQTDAAGVSAIADFTARDAAKAFKMADAKATYAAVLTIDDDTHAATFALRVGDVTDVAVVGTCPKADDTPNKSYAADALAWAARLNTSCDGKAFAPVGTYTFDGKAFAAALKQVALSASVDNNLRPLWRGVHMAFDDGGVRVEATDRFRVSRLTVAAADATSDSHEDCDVVVSAPELCGIVQAFADGKSSTVTVEVYHGMLRVRGAAFAGVDVILQTMDGEYPHVQSLYGHADVTCVGSIKAADVIAAVKRVCSNWNRKRNVTPVHLSGNGNVVIVWDPETLMHVRFNVPCGEFNFSFNPRFLVDALTQTADADGCVSISGVKREGKDVVPSHVKPVQFCGADGAAGIETVVVPMYNPQGNCVPCPFFAPATTAAGNDAADVAETSAPKTDAADVAETASADMADTADTTDDIAQVETVVVEPVEVEHDGVVDVELAETSETIPVVEAETRSVESAPQLPAECSAETQEIPEVPPQTNEDAQAVAESEPAGPRAALYRSTCDSAGNDYTMVVDGCGMSTREAASFVADYIRNNIRPNFRNVGMESAFCVTVDARVRVTAKICGVGGVRAEVEYYRLNAEVSYRCFSVWAESADYFGKAIRDRGVTDAWDKTISFARGIEVALKRDKLIHKHDGNECAARVETYGEAIGYKDASTYDERVVSLPVGGFIEPGASDVPGVPSETVTAVPAEPRTVESAPVLPAGCDAVTQEIPEVPPQTNEDARVLQVSEHVIPACVTLKEYELTRNVPRKRRREFRDSRGRKCAYVVRADTGAFILWRSWYKHEDAEMDAAVRAYYAQVA